MSKEFSKYDLPNGWVWTTIGELGIVVSGGVPNRFNSWTGFVA